MIFFIYLFDIKWDKPFNRTNYKSMLNIVNLTHNNTKNI